MRDITKVCKFLKDNVVPKEETAVIQLLDHISEKAAYTPPESQGRRWYDLMIGLGELLGMPDCPWKQRVSDIVGDLEKIPNCEYVPPGRNYDPNTQLGKDMSTGEYGAPCDPKRFGE